MCWQQPDFGSCASCLCAVDQSGCQAYIDVFTQHLYCGQTCAMICAEFCANPDKITPSVTCDACASGIDCNMPSPGSPQEVDCNGAIGACQADPSCINFGQELQNCPPG